MQAHFSLYSLRSIQVLALSAHHRDDPDIKRFFVVCHCDYCFCHLTGKTLQK